MRIWSLHPSLLDAKGLVALWRETLLAKHVLQGDTKGYTQHPQLTRFKSVADPLAAIHLYLRIVYEEAVRRGYAFDGSKFEVRDENVHITVTQGQVAYEYAHLMKKLLARDRKKHEENTKRTDQLIHPIFTLIPGSIEEWEVVQ